MFTVMNASCDVLIISRNVSTFKQGLRCSSSCVLDSRRSKTAMVLF
jgi:hypothetical protein